MEIGSYRGESAEIFLNSRRVSFIYCVDPWRDYDDSDDEAARCGGMHEVELDFDLRMSAFPGRFSKLKMTSAEAAHEIGTVDAVYIDGSHRYEAVMDDLNLWVPKVRNGGVVAGHDWNKSTVASAVFCRLGTPHETLVDSSWLFHL